MHSYVLAILSDPHHCLVPPLAYDLGKLLATIADSPDQTSSSVKRKELASLERKVAKDAIAEVPKRQCRYTVATAEISARACCGDHKERSSFNRDSEK
jgi:hypothetical protein